ncbi:MAG: DUF3102 domain-containing protein [Gemmatimonadaceae bacterium]
MSTKKKSNAHRSRGVEVFKKPEVVAELVVMDAAVDTTAVALCDVSLEQLAADIKREHEATENGIRNSLEHARTAGEMLSQVKDRLKHGEFMPWVELHCGFSHSTANLYMKIAEEWTTLGNSQRVVNFSLHEASKLLYKGDDAGHDKAVSTKDAFHNESKIGRTLRLLGKSIGHFLDVGYNENLYVDMILEDRTLHRREVEGVRDSFLVLRHRVNTAIDKLTERTLVNVDALDALDDEQRERQRQLDSRIAEIAPELLAS